MRLVLHVFRLLFLWALCHKAICHSLDGKLEKRIRENTRLWELSHDREATDLYHVITASDRDPYDDVKSEWEKDGTRLIALSTNDLVLSVQTNAGAWLCAMQSGKWVKMGSKTEEGTRLLRELWTDGCEESLKATLDHWKKILSKEGIQVKIFQAQVFALGLTSPPFTPLGFKARQSIVPGFKRILGLHPQTFIPLMGWPQAAYVSRTAEAGFVLVQNSVRETVQDPVQENAQKVYETTFQIYATGTGPAESGTRRHPSWGTRPALEIKLQAGFAINRGCEDIFIFQESTVLRKSPFAESEAKDPTYPYFGS